MTTDPAIYTLGQEDVIKFMKRLRDSGMGSEKVAEYGYEYALGLSEKWQSEPVPRFWQMHYASYKLEQAALEIGIHLKQQRKE